MVPRITVMWHNRRQDDANSNKCMLKYCIYDTLYHCRCSDRDRDECHRGMKTVTNAKSRREQDQGLRVGIGGRRECHINFKISRQKTENILTGVVVFLSSTGTSSELCIHYISRRQLQFPSFPTSLNTAWFLWEQLLKRVTVTGKCCLVHILLQIGYLVLDCHTYLWCSSLKKSNSAHVKSRTALFYVRKYCVDPHKLAYRLIQIQKFKLQQNIHTENVQHY